MTVSCPGPYPVTLNLKWTPDGAGPATIEITGAAGNSITIPSNADAIRVWGGGFPAVVLPIDTA